MSFCNKIKSLDTKIVLFEKHSLYLNEFRKYLAANLGRSPFSALASLLRSTTCIHAGVHSYGYASAGDQPTLFAIFPLNFVPFMQHVG